MPNWFDKTDNEVLQVIKDQLEVGDDLIVVGKYRKIDWANRPETPKVSKELFLNIRNKNFVPLTYVGHGNEFLGRQIRIEIREPHTYELQNDWYQFKIKLAEIGLRRHLNNPSLITVDLSYKPIPFRPNEKDFVLNLYQRKANGDLENDRNNIQSLRIIEREINRVKEAFVYELLQNADDYPVEGKKVDVKIITAGNKFIFTHTGSPFRFNNVYALCNINDGDKQDDIDKIGYKGIGFKSVFAYSEKVLIKSGKYIFKFDKRHSGFQRDKPYQIIPIWVDNLQNLRGLPISENVNIVIEAKQGEEKVEEWKELLIDIFSQESNTPVILFLRNIKNVFVNSSPVSQTTRGWWFGEFKIKIPENERLELKRLFETNTGNIPEKLVGVSEIEIQFALKHDNYSIQNLQEAIIYNYLPTKANLGFSFLVNSDFIPTGDRHYLFENNWNRYLMREAGVKFLEWLASLGLIKNKTNNLVFKKDYLKLLPNLAKNISELKSKSSNNLFLIEEFKKGFDLSLKGNGTLNPVSFIPTADNKLESLQNIFVDETGISSFLSTEDFKHLTGITLKSIHSEVGVGLEAVKLLIKEYEVGTIFTLDKLKSCLKFDKFQAWLKIPNNNFDLLQHLFNSSNAELKAFLDTEKIILTESCELSKAEEIYTTIPDEVTFISNNKINSTLKTLLDKSKVELKTTKFRSANFLISNKGKVNSLLTTESNIINFWNFVYDNWKELKEHDEVKKSLSLFNTLCKPIKADELNIKQVSATYLCKEMALGDEVESIIESLKLKDKFFINTVFVTKGYRKQLITWTEIFAGAKRGLSDLIGELIPQLKDLEDSLHFKACNEIFKYWNRNKEKPEKQLSPAQIATLKQTLKLKCENGFFLASKCIIPEYYTGDQRTQEILPSIVLNCQITQEYQPRESLVSDWKQFFVLIGCKDLNSEQKIFNEKVDYLLTNQLAFRATHFTTIKEIDLLFTGNENKEVKLSFDFTNKLSKIYLQTSLVNAWDLPGAIHLPSAYKPELDLQNDDDISCNFKFLSSDYFVNNISITFLKALGLKSNFEFTLNANSSYSFYPDKILNSKKYLPSFWNYITATELRVKHFYSSDVFNIIKSNESILVKDNSYCIPSTLYSKNLANYIQDKKLIPEIDLTTFFVDAKNTLTLEQEIGVKQTLNVDHCLELLKKENPLSEKEIEVLRLVEIIKTNTIGSEKLIGVKAPNTQYKWLTKEELFFSQDNEIISQYPEKLIHQSFVPIIGQLQIRNISASSFEFKKVVVPDSTSDAKIKKCIHERAEYLAFALKNGSPDYVTCASEIVASVNAISFVKCSEIYFSISYGSLYWKKVVPIHLENGALYFIDDIEESISELRATLHKQFSKFGTITDKYFKRILTEQEKEIIKEFDKKHDIPPSWKEKIAGSYKKEVEDFINELENTEWSEYIPELKSILELSISHPKEKQKLFNLVAKLKLAQERNIHFESAGTDYNHLENEQEKYFVHSARGSFAYIHTNEILQMKKGGYKMALDFGAKSKIKIYNTAEEILQLNTNHILAYQYEKSLDDLFSFCEANKDANKHLLILDKNNSREKSKDILKLLNPEDDYQ